MLAMDDRDGGAPIALAGNPPIAQTKGHLTPAPAALLGQANHMGLGILDAHAIEKMGMSEPPRPGIGFRPHAEGIG